MKKWKVEELEYLKLNYKLGSMDKMVKDLGRSVSSIMAKAHYIGISGRNKSNNKQNDISYLLSDDITSLYWIGFILADGHVGTKHIKIAVSELDKDHIKILAALLNVRVYVYDRSSGYSSKNSTIHEISAFDTKLINIFRNKYKLNHTNKTMNPPKLSDYNLSSDMLISMIIGFIDGDGCISKTSNGYDRITIQLHNSWYDNLCYINDKLHTIANVPRTNNIQIDNRGYASLSISKKKILSFLMEYIKTNNIPTLKRKWDVISF